MRAFLLPAVLFLLAAPAAAQQPRYPLLAQCLGNETGVRRWYHALSPEAQDSFEALYAEYAALVRRNKEDGWSNGWRGNLWTNVRNDFSAHPVLGLFKSAVNYTDSRTKLVEEALPQAEANLATAERNAAAAPNSAVHANGLRLARQRVEELREYAAQKAGTCSDWATEVKFVLSRVPQPHFAIDTEVSVAVGALGDSGSHMYAKVCPKAGGECVVLDPWKRGYPELTTAAEQARGVSNANSCFSVNRPVE